MNTFAALVALMGLIFPEYISSSRLPPTDRWKFAHEKGPYFEGDIVLPPQFKAGSDSALWSEGVIPYAFHPRFSQPQRRAVLNALRDIESKTCIRFKPRQRERDFVWVTNFNQGCFSYVGRSGSGGQQLNLASNCFHRTTIIHEFVHAVGFWHEQSRQDRDRWINIHWNNIPQNFKREFGKHTHLNNYGTDYDYRSVMHYSYNAFARDWRRPTISPKQQFPLKQLGSGDANGGLTEIDALQINKRYNCPQRT